MATKEEKAELIEILSFTPRTYKISMWGYGGEKVMGTVSQESWDYCMANQVDLSDIAWNSEAHVDMDLDADLLPFQPGSWYECDDMGHINGVSRDAGTIQVEDENGNTVLERSLDSIDGTDIGLCCNDEVWVGSKPKGTIVFVGSSNEKGTFFEGEIELRAPFDIEKLELQYDEFDGEDIVGGLVYDGEEIDNWGGSTDGKSSDFNMVRITDDNGSFERYEPEEKDWGHPEVGTSPSSWESSPKFKFKKHKPVHLGWYSCIWSSFGTTYGTLYWNGKEFGEWEYGKFKPQSGVDTWQGYNWNTSSWVNQPPEPADVICDNKECGWVGKGEDRRTDDDYNDHCPNCGGTEFLWIDYDPDTKEGRGNRAKYCKPWDPALALEKIEVPTDAEKVEFIAGLDAALAELAKESGIDFDNGEVEVNEVKLPKGSWPFGPDETTEETMEESTSKWWSVKTYYKKSCEQHEYFYTREIKGASICVKDGFRFAEFNVETSNGEFPEFNFTNCPGGSADLDSVDLFSCFGDNVEQTELVEMFDGGCWGDVEIEGIEDEDEVERLRTLIEEEGSYALEEDGGWYLSDTECWVWGPLEVTDDEGNTRIICADKDGNMIDFKEE